MPSTIRLHDSGNDLLDRLPAVEFDFLAPLLRKESFTLKQVVHPYDVEVTKVYFPTTALVSLLNVMEEDDPVESSTVGREGFIGLAAGLGVGASPHRALCQLGGDSLCLSLPEFLEALKRGPELTRLFHLYAAYMMKTGGQAAACNALHPVEARASRWLLLIHDQVGRDEFPMTQEFLAYMLGVRRQTVTVVAGTLQSAGLIGFRRGMIEVRDRGRLEEAACECYASIRDYYRRVVR